MIKSTFNSKTILFLLSGLVLVLIVLSSIYLKPTHDYLSIFETQTNEDQNSQIDLAEEVINDATVVSIKSTSAFLSPPDSQTKYRTDSVVLDNGEVIEQIFDAQNRLIKTVTLNNEVILYTYDRDGNLLDSN